MSDLISKLPNVGTTIFTVMSKMAAEHNAINLSQGFPNFPVAEELKSEYKKVIDNNYHQYMPMPGSPKLLIEVAQKLQLHYFQTTK